MKYPKELVDHFIFEEGFRLKSYKDTEGYYTIGVGRMLGKDSKYANIKITKETAMEMLEEDINEAYITARKLIRDFDSHPETVKLALLDMSFNLGYPKLSKFIQTLSYVSQRKYKDAGAQALKSKWSTQVPNRAARVAKLFESG